MIWHPCYYDPFRISIGTVMFADGLYAVDFAKKRVLFPILRFSHR